ncbi:hypothetical protein PR048_002192 [Dryococelus australis]|uniref:YqaJ viral recombinase domain-containing protein n=1 Tax=Dryococelus australis TaxID=614101 RepID=A0ABQ9IJN5_9NEOP|nr:hypothetical protein PR048_002192 [Dryococelus australis]
MRNYNRRLREIATKTKNATVETSCCSDYRNKYRSAEDLPLQQRIDELAKDIHNGPYHVFGDHRRSSERGYFCKIIHKHLILTTVTSTHNTVNKMSQEEFEMKKEKFKYQLRLTEYERNRLQENTISQSNSYMWMAERSKRLAASHFGKICTKKSSTPRAKTVISMICRSFQGNTATRYGLEKEPIATEQLNKELEKYIKPADGIIDHDSIIEVKCPFVAAQLTPESAIRQNKIKFCLIENGQLHLKENDSYMFQVQDQLQIANKKTCYFVVWTPLGILIEIIERSTKFWEEKMVDKLNEFDMDHILLELMVNLLAYIQKSFWFRYGLENFCVAEFCLAPSAAVASPTADGGIRSEDIHEYYPSGRRASCWGGDSCALVSHSASQPAIQPSPVNQMANFSTTNTPEALNTTNDEQRLLKISHHCRSSERGVCSGPYTTHSVAAVVSLCGLRKFPSSDRKEHIAQRSGRPALLKIVVSRLLLFTLRRGKLFLRRMVQSLTEPSETSCLHTIKTPAVEAGAAPRVNHSKRSMLQSYIYSGKNPDVTRS